MYNFLLFPHMYLEEYFSNSFCNLFCRFLFKSFLRLLSFFFKHILHFFCSQSLTFLNIYLCFLSFVLFFSCFFCLLTELNCFWFFIDIFQLDTYTCCLSFLSHPKVYCSNMYMHDLSSLYACMAKKKRPSLCLGSWYT